MLYRIAFGVFRYFVYTDAGDGIQATSYIRNFVFRCHPLFASNYWSLGKEEGGLRTLVLGNIVARTCRGFDSTGYYCSGQLRWNIAPLCTPALFCEHEFVGKNIGANKKPQRGLVSKLCNEITYTIYRCIEKFQAKWNKLFCGRQFSVYLVVSYITNLKQKKCKPDGIFLK